jgi:alanine racemase
MDAKQSLGEPRLLISRDALLHNAALLRRTVGDAVRICAILKADAYGHGAELVADTLYNFSTDDLEGPAVDAFAVASIDEAEALPVTTLPVLIFRPVENIFLGRQRARLESAIRNGWVLTLCAASAADDIARIAVGCGKRALVQVMIDTGMSRSGVAMELAAELLETVTRHASLRLHGICTHFAESEEDNSPLTLRQIDRFRAATDEFVAGYQGKVLRHAANSAAMFFRPQSHFDMVRPGISLYGIDPLLRPSLDRPLRPVMKWTAPLVHVRDIERGTGVGYNQTWRAQRDTRIGLVPVGYADGYPRSLSNNACMLVGGKTAPVVGRVSMDCVTLDLSNIPEANLGDEATILDSDPLSPVSVYELARWAHTIPYEITSRIGPRVHRVALEVEPGPRFAREETGERRE